MKCLRILFGAFLALGGTLLGSQSPPPVIEPQTYRSPSGKYHLEVDPSDIHGRGESKCRLVAGATEAWAASLPFTFVEAAVTDDGTVAGFGYTEGERGWARKGPNAGPGELRVAILDPRGAFRLDKKIPRKDTLVIHGSPEPMLAGILVHPNADRFTTRYWKDSGEQWESFELSTGKALKPIAVKPSGEGAAGCRSIERAVPLPGTPLSLVQWWHYEEGRGTGALFTLVDQDGKQVWELFRPGDYTIPGDEDASFRLGALVHRDGSILETRDPGEFALWLPREKKRARYSVKQSGERWEVTELGREDYAPPKPEAPAFPKTPERPLERLGSFVLGDKPAVSPIRNIAEFGFDDRGGIGFVRWESQQQTFVLLNATGKLLAEIPIPESAERQIVSAWVGADRWIVTSSPQGYEGKTRAWWVENNKATELGSFECPYVEAIAGSEDGGFVVLAKRRQRFSTDTDALIAFGKDGQKRWAHEENDYTKPGGLFSPEDITVTSKREIALLDVIRHTVQFFDLDGKYLRTLEIDKVAGREMEYPSEITSDKEGGVLIYDSPRETLEWIAADGKLRGQVRPRHADGKKIAGRNLRVAPDGTLWVSDQFAFLEVDRTGVVKRVIGEPLDPNALGTIGFATADTHGCVYASDERSGTVFVFDAEGKPERACKLSPEDFSTFRGAELQVENDGSIYVGLLAFGPDGKRIGAKKFDTDSVRENLRPRHEPGGYLLLQWQGACIVDEGGKVSRRIERRPDRKWVQNPDGTVADDGSFVLHTGGPANDSESLHFYTRDGEPVRSASIPGGNLIGYNGRHVVLTWKDEVWIIDPSGNVVQHFAPSKNGLSDQALMLTRSGRELWKLDTRTRAVERFAMPSPR